MGFALYLAFFCGQLFKGSESGPPQIEEDLKKTKLGYTPIAARLRYIPSP